MELCSLEYSNQVGNGEDQIRDGPEGPEPASMPHRSNESFNTVNITICPLIIVEQTKNIRAQTLMVDLRNPSNIPTKSSFKTYKAVSGLKKVVAMIICRQLTV